MTLKELIKKVEEMSKIAETNLMDLPIYISLLSAPYPNRDSASQLMFRSISCLAYSSHLSI